jgi:pimeloyl-ACP methyl ester carboxylesterase
VPYASLPALPRLDHPFFSPACRDERVRVRTPHFGEVTLAVRRFGGAKPGAKKLVCIHGLMTSSYSFRYLLERLGGECEVIAPDLPGAGRSDAPDLPYGPEALADLLGALLRELGLGAPSVLGNSMGGYLAMHLAMRHPGSVGRLVNLHSPGIVTPRMRALDAALRLPGAPGLLDVLVSRDPRRWVWKNVHYYDESLKSREEVEEYSAPLQTPAGRRAFARYLADTLSVAGMRRFERDLSSLARFPTPLLLVYARSDPMVPPAVGERLAALVPDARLTWLERGSHFAHVDAPDDFLAAAKDFLLGDG